MPLAHFNIGSNLGDRADNLSRAVAAIISLLDSPSYSVSDIVESEPWGFESAHLFLNIGLAVETNLPPMALLEIALQAEKLCNASPHRNASGGYIDRTADIDLIALGKTVCNTPRLTLPHPRMHLRPFVLRPMLQLEPEWSHPILGLTLQQMIETCQ